MNNMTDTPMYDNVRLDLGIDPQDQNGHDDRVRRIIAKHPSKLFSTADGRLAPPRNSKINRKPPKRR